MTSVKMLAFFLGRNEFIKNIFSSHYVILYNFLPRGVMFLDTNYSIIIMMKCDDNIGRNINISTMSLTRGWDYLYLYQP